MLDITGWLGAQTWNFWQWGALLLGGVGCGFVNTLAGGGSMITMPLLIFLGLPPNEANATNRFALTFQYFISALGFWTQGQRDVQSLWKLVIPGLMGTALGSWFAILVDPALFQTMLAILLLIVVIPVVFRKNTWIDQATEQKPSTSGWWLSLVFFGIGVYSGFIQIGVGIWSLLALLGMGGFSLNHANAIKAQLLCVYALLATILFILHGQVWYGVAFGLAAANGVGAWIATRVAYRYSLTWVRWLLLVVVLLSSMRLLGVF